MATENDIVLIYYEDHPAGFARIEEILPDHKPNWFHVKLLLLQIPLQIVTWILRDVYINGEEFTMNGKRMRLERVESPEEATEKKLPNEDEVDKVTVEGESPGKGKVISLTDLKKKS